MTAEAKLREATLRASRINSILLERHPVLHDDSLLNDMRQIIAGEFEEALVAARREALEEAATIAEEMNTVRAMSADGLRDPRIVALDIAKGIRALASRAAGEREKRCAVEGCTKEATNEYLYGDDDRAFCNEHTEPEQE